jgi:hypothetical protein
MIIISDPFFAGIFISHIDNDQTEVFGFTQQSETTNSNTMKPFGTTMTKKVIPAHKVVGIDPITVPPSVLSKRILELVLSVIKDIWIAHTSEGATLSQQDNSKPRSDINFPNLSALIHIIATRTACQLLCNETMVFDTILECGMEYFVSDFLPAKVPSPLSRCTGGFNDLNLASEFLTSAIEPWHRNRTIDSESTQQQQPVQSSIPSDAPTENKVISSVEYAKASSSSSEFSPGGLPQFLPPRGYPPRGYPSTPFSAQSQPASFTFGSSVVQANAGGSESPSPYLPLSTENVPQNATTANSFVLAEGVRVEGNYRGLGLWYGGKVIKVNDNDTFDIQFDDGDRETSVGRSNIREPKQQQSTSTSSSGTFGWASLTANQYNNTTTTTWGVREELNPYTTPQAGQDNSYVNPYTTAQANQENSYVNPYTTTQAGQDNSYVNPYTTTQAGQENSYVNPYTTAQAGQDNSYSDYQGMLCRHDLSFRL